MSPRPLSPPDATALLDDFEWPPAADDVSVHAIDADPWDQGDADDIDEATGVIFEPATPAPPSPPSLDRRRER